MALTPASLRSLRSRASSTAVFPASSPPSRPEAGSTGELTTTVPLAAATSAAATPPGSVATTRASPPPGGSSHSFAPSAAAPSGLLPGSGRREVNSSEPSGRNRGLASPSADLVSRRGGAPWVSIRQMLVRYFLPSALSVCTAAASQLPSGASRSAATRGMARKSVRSPTAVAAVRPSSPVPALTGPPASPQPPAPTRTIPRPWPDPSSWIETAPRR